MSKLITAGAVVAIAGSAQAAFSLNSVDLGGDAASFGSPITASTNYYQDSFGNNYPPSAAFIGVFPELAFDSYIAMDSMGASTSSYTANGPGGSTPGFGATAGHFPDPATLTGGYFTGGGVASGTDPFGGNGVMIAQLAVSFSGTLTGDNIRVNTSGDQTGTFSLVLDGAGEGGLFAKSFQTADNQVAGSANYDVYEIWVTDAPTPGAMALFGVAGLAAARRRR